MQSATGQPSRETKRGSLQQTQGDSLSGVDGSQPGHNFLGNYRDRGVRW
jgi:hypothetical protein